VAKTGVGQNTIQFTGTLAALLDVPLRITVELGRTQLPLADILRLTSGSLVELDQLASEPLAIKAGGRLIARGVAIVVNGRLGVRLTEIIAPNAADSPLSEAG
jgi:flagellar motor switch protein FliN/FliY